MKNYEMLKRSRRSTRKDGKLEGFEIRRRFSSSRRKLFVRSEGALTRSHPLRAGAWRHHDNTLNHRSQLTGINSDIHPTYNNHSGHNFNNSHPHPTQQTTKNTMKTALCIIASTLPLTAVVAFAPQASTNSNDIASMIALNAEAFIADSSSTAQTKRQIFDPLGLYPLNSPERTAGLIEPLEVTTTTSSSSVSRDIFDPLRLYQSSSSPFFEVDVEMSASLPFLRRPALLDRTLPGDRGFDPFNFASTPSDLIWQRRAEIKHARLAMLGVAGWLSAELLHGPIAQALNLPTMLASSERVPSILNDGLVHAAFPAFWIGTIALAAVIEIGESVEENTSMKLDPADMGFDPLGLGGTTRKEKFFMKEAELFYGRLGMLAITGFAVQEFFLHSAVVNQMPFELMREMML